MRALAGQLWAALIKIAQPDTLEGVAEQDQVEKLQLIAMEAMSTAPAPSSHVAGNVPQLGGAPEDLRNTLCAVIEYFGPEGAAKVTGYALKHRSMNAFTGKPLVGAASAEHVAVSMPPSPQRMGSAE
ncbi:hypothetical protein [Rhizobium leguminosarum]